MATILVKRSIGGGGGSLLTRQSETTRVGGAGACSPGKFFKFEPSEMAGNAFKTNMLW